MASINLLRFKFSPALSVSFNGITDMGTIQSAKCYATSLHVKGFEEDYPIMITLIFRLLNSETISDFHWWNGRIWLFSFSITAVKSFRLSVCNRWWIFKYFWNLEFLPVTEKVNAAVIESYETNLVKIFSKFFKVRFPGDFWWNQIENEIQKESIMNLLVNRHFMMAQTQV